MDYFTHGCASIGRLTRTYQQQLCMATGCSLGDLPETLVDRDEWQKRESGKSVLAVQHNDDD